MYCTCFSDQKQISIKRRGIREKHAQKRKTGILEGIREYRDLILASPIGI
jgi:hypothetical protein